MAPLDIRGLLGEVNYDVFDCTADMGTAPFALSVFYFFNIFVLLVMFVAIITDAYEAALHKELAYVSRPVTHSCSQLPSEVLVCIVDACVPRPSISAAR